MLFRWDPERIHQFFAEVLSGAMFRPAMAFWRYCHAREDPALATSLCGIPLAHPVGLAAGFDKDAQFFHHLHHFGFSFAEIGTVTPRAQPGNERPRLFRLPRDRALINRMGFNNGGAESAARRLSRHARRIPVGGNVGKNKATPLDQSTHDYTEAFRILKPVVDFVVVNVSSPNTPQLRSLQQKGPLTEMLQALAEANTPDPRPILLKVAPDLERKSLDDIAEVVATTGVRGVIATNTTLSREGLATSEDRIREIGAGGLSGAPLEYRAREVCRILASLLPKDVDLVGVGGIFTGEQAWARILAGAGCLQIYTAFVYRGPAAVFSILRELKRAMQADGFDRLDQAVGKGVQA